MASVWQGMRSGREGESVVVVPSRVVADPHESPAASQAYEERFLFLLLLLRQPALRVIFVSSLPIDERIVDYYFGLLAGVIPAQAKSRLSLVSVHDGSPAPLSQKLLERPRMLDQIRSLIPDRSLCHLVPYATTALERDLSLVLGIPMYGADPQFAVYGGKSGCRKLFAEEGVPHPLGIEDIRSLDDAAAAIARIRAERPGVREVIVKTNEGAAGAGNALVNLEGLPAPGAAEEAAEISRRLAEMSFEKETLTLDVYSANLERQGGIVEERIVGLEFQTPSVQLRITPVGTVEILSTHDQIVGGPSGQQYLGCRFPANPAYVEPITKAARAVGERLAREGVLGRFAIDFVAVRDGAESWRVSAIELNLRKGGTTHPYLTLEFLSGGAYDADAGTFWSSDGSPKCLVATDHLESPSLRGLTPIGLFDVIVRHGLQFDQGRQVGVVFHMMSALTELGTIGFTAIGNTHAEADELYSLTSQVLLEEAATALAPARLAPVA
jgi:hypothetical protein